MEEEKKAIPGALLVVAAIIGIIIGAITGLLLAPQSGKKTRDQIRESYNGAVRSLNDFVQRTEEKILEKMPSVKENPEQVKGEILHFTKEATGP